MIISHKIIKATQRPSSLIKQDKNDTAHKATPATLPQLLALSIMDDDAKRSKEEERRTQQEELLLPWKNNQKAAAQLISPLQFLVMTQAHVHTISHCYDIERFELYREETLTPDLPAVAREYGAKHEVISFLVKALEEKDKEYISEDEDEDEDDSSFPPAKIDEHELRYDNFKYHELLHWIGYYDGGTEEGYAMIYGRHSRCLAIPFSESFLPLHYLAAARADLETIEHVYKLYPQALTSEVLQIPCRFGAKPGVIPFLVQALPEAASNIGVEGYLPIHEVIERGPKEIAFLENLEALLDAYPQSLLIRNPWSEHTPLEFFLRLSFKPQFLESLASRFPDQVEVLRLELSVNSSTDGEKCRDEIDMDCVKFISAILPKLKQLSISHDDREFNWNGDALAAFLQEIVRNNTITKFKLKVPDDYLAPGCSKMQMIQDLLARNSVIEELHLAGSFTSWNPELYNWCDSFLNVLRPNSNISKLTLSDMKFQNDLVLCGFLFSGRAPKSVEIRGCHFSNEDTNLRNVPYTSMDFPLTGTKTVEMDDFEGDRESFKVFLASMPFLRRLYFWDFRFCGIEALHIDLEGNKHRLFGLLWQLPRMPFLRRLSVCADVFDIVALLFQLILMVDQLESLEWKCPLASQPINERVTCVSTKSTAHTLQPLLDALKTNKSLTKLSITNVKHKKGDKFCRSLIDILKKDNTTLEHVNLSFCQKKHRKVFDYYLMLNECGRGKARDPETSKRGLVDLLSERNKFNDFEDSVDQINVLFCLLSGSLSIWGANK
mgnify:CR=1 FL=1